MSPDELLVLVPYEDADKTVAILTKSFGKAHFLAENVSDARAVFQIKGPNAAEVLAKVCPVDLSPAAFKPGMIRRSRLAQIAASLDNRSPPDALHPVALRHRKARAVLRCQARPLL